MQPGIGAQFSKSCLQILDKLCIKCIVYLWTPHGDRRNLVLVASLNCDVRICWHHPAPLMNYVYLCVFICVFTSGILRMAHPAWAHSNLPRYPSPSRSVAASLRACWPPTAGMCALGLIHTCRGEYARPLMP